MSLSPAKLIFGQEKNRPASKGSFAIPYEAKTDAAFYFTHETFAPYVNSTFRISRGKAVSFDATLVEVSNYQAQSRTSKVQTQVGECFSLSFRAGERDAVSQGTYKFVHPALGRFSLFIVPSESTAGGTTYEAIINHLA